MQAYRDDEGVEIFKQQLAGLSRIWSQECSNFMTICTYEGVAT